MGEVQSQLVYLLQISAVCDPPRGAGLCSGVMKLVPPSCGCLTIASNLASDSCWYFCKHVYWNFSFSDVFETVVYIHKL